MAISVFDRLATWWLRRKEIRALVKECEQEQYRLLEAFFSKYCEVFDEESSKINFPEITWPVLRVILAYCAASLDQSGYPKLSASMATIRACAQMNEPDLFRPLLHSTPAGVDKDFEKMEKKSAHYAVWVRQAVVGAIDDFSENHEMDMSEYTDNHSEGRQSNRIAYLKYRIARTAILVDHVKGMRTTADLGVSLP